ncbi:MAG: hypothetical protein AB1921_09520 [Thermodesulfobacteriota bacterium]
MDFSEMSIDELFYRVETLLKKKGLHSVSETWRETAVRIKDQEPELADFLHRAMDRWEEMN